TPEGWTSCAPGPWGSLAFVRMSIEIPDEYISAHLHETAPSRWFFNHYTPEKLTDLLNSVELSADARTELLDRSKWTISPGGISIAPSSQIVLSLSKAARSTIYGVLAEYSENVAQDQPYIFAPGSFEKRFADSGLADATISLVQRLCYPHGSLQLFADLPAALQMLPSYEEK